MEFSLRRLFGRDYVETTSRGRNLLREIIYDEHFTLARVYIPNEDERKTKQNNSSLSPFVLTVIGMHGWMARFFLLLFHLLCAIEKKRLLCP